MLFEYLYERFSRIHACIVDILKLSPIRVLRLIFNASGIVLHKVVHFQSIVSRICKVAFTFTASRVALATMARLVMHAVSNGRFAQNDILLACQQVCYRRIEAEKRFCDNIETPAISI